MRLLLFLLFTFPCIAQKSAATFQVELSDSLKKAVHLYVKEQEKRFGLSNKKHVIGLTLRAIDPPECYISATGKKLNIRDFPSLYISKVDGYWISIFILDFKNFKHFKYPKPYTKFAEENLLPLLEKESTAYPRDPFHQWIVRMPPDKPMDMKISL